MAKFFKLNHHSGRPGHEGYIGDVVEAKTDADAEYLAGLGCAEVQPQPQAAMVEPPQKATQRRPRARKATTTPEV